MNIENVTPDMHDNNDKGDFILELFSEEIPANMQKAAEEGYYRIFDNYFSKNEINLDELKVFIGPRRISVIAKGMSLTVPSKNIEMKGPRIDAPAKAIEGFCASNSVNKEDLEIRDVKGKQCYFLVQNISEQRTSDILSQTIAEPIAEYVWPKSMYWGKYKIKWVRPLHNILCILSGKTVSFEYGHLVSNNQTFGHRFMAPDAISINSLEDYFSKLQNAYVVIDRQERLEIITNQINQVLKKYSLELKKDEALLNEVAGLVEYPKVLIGKINDKFLELPDEVLVTAMKVHQKYFSTVDNSGKFAPYFVFVTNIISSNESVVISGNEKVLSARLSDALHFYHQDLKVHLESAAIKLDKVVFHEKLGSLKDKTDRLIKLCQHIDSSDVDAQIAAKICKSDIVSEMVGEFANLQGIMGYHYAVAQGYSDNVAKSVRDHYKPVGEGDISPEAESVVLALGDKIDTLTGLMIAGEKPTGSKDPYALRRIAIGTIRNIIENNLRINLFDLISYAASLFTMPEKDRQVTAKEILFFIEERVRHYYKGKNNQSYIAAALDLSKNPDLVLFGIKLNALERFMQSKHSENLLNAYKRATNIISKGKNTNVTIGNDVAVKEELFSTDYESELYSKVDQVLSVVQKAIQIEDYDSAFAALADLVLPLDSFFENVLVNDANSAIAANRSALLARVRYAFNLIVDFDSL